MTKDTMHKTDTVKTATADLLIEIGCEELPPLALKGISNNFKDLIEAGLNRAMLSFEGAHCFASPRRIAVLVSKLSLKQPQTTQNKRGPKVEAAFDSENNPTPVALGFAKGCGVSVKDLQILDTPQGRHLIFESVNPGFDTATLIPNIIKDALHSLPLAKRMRWGNLEESFSRPVHWVVILFGDKPLAATFFGIESEAKTQGHRFMAPAAISLKVPAEYEEVLFKKGKVIADFSKRREHIIKAIDALATSHQLTPILDETLLEENTNLVEWPVVLLGSFDSKFLTLPKEVLMASMTFHQKCFPSLDQNKALSSHFFIISNIEASNPKEILLGNERVMHARLQDAAFHYGVDKEQSLEDRQEDLKKIIFQKQLGTLWDKTLRIAKLAEFIAKTIGGDAKATTRAALLCKTDLLTQMVGEFPELQGVMGYYYAKLHKEPESVALAIKEHYYPRFSADSLPETKEGAVLAIADRLDTLVGLFAIGKEPTGESDPFGLRRQAFALLRILIEGKLSLDLKEAIHFAHTLYGALISKEAIFEEKLLDFCFERLRAWYHDQTISARVFDAVLAKRPTNPLDFHQRLQAVQTFIGLPEAESLSMANKRVKNILTKSEIVGASTPINPALFEKPAEKTLFSALHSKETEIKPLIKKGAYTEALKQLTALKEPIDTFFDEVMVMVEDPLLKNNRIALLSQLRSLFLEIADLSLL